MVARWDLAVNGRFYSRTLMLIVGCITLPVVYKSLQNLLMYGLWGVADDGVSVLPGFYAMFFGMLMVSMCCYTFHSLLTRQGRINELTLPATNAERFTWHVLFTIVGTAAAFALSVVAADLINVLMGAMRHASGLDDFLAVQTWQALMSAPLSLCRTFSGDYGEVMFVVFVFLMVAGWLSTFVLGSAWKYRHTMATVIMYNMVLSLLFSLLPVMLANVMPPLHSVVRFLENHDGSVITVLVLVALGILCLMWWLTYRLYCHAQITTRRNP